MKKEYNHIKIEKKWQDTWDKNKTYGALDKSKKPKFFSLIEFPYPSGDGLHVGHPRPYIGMDVVSRKRRMDGQNVLFPIGWDAFGLPTENYAIKTGKQPKDVTKKNTDNFRRQIKMLGISFDWSREINTTDPNYYKWTQWLFLQFFKKGLAYKTKSEINWCPKDKIGLANEEVIDGKCERCGTQTVKKEKEQWMLGITKYAERLDKDLDLVDFPERVKASQRNWIGRSEGSEIDFPIVGPKMKKIVILHGRAMSPEKAFVPWLKKNLEEKGFEVFAPQLPNAKNPNDEEQADFLMKNISFDESTVIVGHSFGGIVAMRLLERGIKVHGVVFVATPITGIFKDNGNRPTVKEAISKGFEYEKILSKADYFKVLSDSTDIVVPQEDGELLAKKLNTFCQSFAGVEPHFCGKEEPEIMNALLPNIKVFTTRADTLFGVTYVVLAPEHPLVQSRKKVSENKKEVEKYLEGVMKKSDIERTENKQKTGVELKGLKVINPVNGEELPVWIADYVLPHYGTGAVMAVPAHDERDHEFAKKYNLPIRHVIEQKFEIHNGDGAIRPDLPFVFRNAVCAVVRNPKDGKYLCVSWKKFLMHGFVTGGIEEGEDFVEGALREIYEETGYKNVRLVKDPNIAIHSLFYHRVKEQNRWARFQYLFFELINEERDPIDKKESDLHEVVWKSKDELKDFFTVIEGKFVLNILSNENYIFTGDGVLHFSGEFDGMDSDGARKKITEKVCGRIVTKFKLRDWIFSRQRYWGEPIPVVNCAKCGLVPLKDKDLPLKLPSVVSYKPTDTGESPLAAISKWVNTKCPKCKGKAKRETDTMPNWAGSSWYYLRYTDPKNKTKFADMKKLKYWTPIDWYNGGMEHTTLHLLYSRFWHKFFYDLKLVPTVEPYMKRTSHGMILGEGGVKMSKSLGNVVNPDSIVKTYGADTLRIYEMFIGPFEDTAVWNTESIIGSRRFIEKVWRLGTRTLEQYKIFYPRGSHSVLREGRSGKKLYTAPVDSSSGSLTKLLHKTIKKVEEDIEAMRFNTAISAMMILATEMEKTDVSVEDFKNFLKILSPFAPHLTEEIWQSLGEKGSINTSPWPKWDKNLINDDEVKIAIQVNGKVRAEIMINVSESEEEIKQRAQKDETILRFTESKEIKKIIYVKNRLVNIVI